MKQLLIFLTFIVTVLFAAFAILDFWNHNFGAGLGWTNAALYFALYHYDRRK